MAVCFFVLLFLTFFLSPTAHPHPTSTLPLNSTRIRHNITQRTSSCPTHSYVRLRHSIGVPHQLVLPNYAQVSWPSVGAAVAASSKNSSISSKIERFNTQRNSVNVTTTTSNTSTTDKLKTASAIVLPSSSRVDVVPTCLTLPDSALPEQFVCRVLLPDKNTTKSVLCHSHYTVHALLQNMLSQRLMREQLERLQVPCDANRLTLKVCICSYAMHASLTSLLFAVYEQSDDPSSLHPCMHTCICVECSLHETLTH